MAAATTASSEINWSAGTEADTEEEEEAAGEPRRVAAVLIGMGAGTAAILEKRES